eukprot:scaffold299970_cov13-Tisochrysis_lutea.AAC.1
MQAKAKARVRQTNSSSSSLGVAGKGSKQPLSCKKGEHTLARPGACAAPLLCPGPNRSMPLHPSWVGSLTGDPARAFLGVPNPNLSLCRAIKATLAASLPALCENCMQTE